MSRASRNRSGRSRAAAVWVAVTLAAIALAVVLDGDRWRGALRAWGLGQVVRMTPAPAAGVVVVVDIDRASLAVIGPWPWPRARLAELVSRVAEGRPAAIGIDIVLHGYARSGALAADDTALAQALASGPTVLAFLLDPDAAGPVEGAPILAAPDARPIFPWSAAGAVMPAPLFVESAAGAGAASLDMGAAGTVAAVPGLVRVGDALLPGLALETLRIARGASSLVLTANEIRAGDLRVPLGPDAAIRLRASAPATWPQRTVSASDVLAMRVPLARFSGQVVLIGGGAPELGALRPTALTPLAPGVQIQADAVAAMLAGRVPTRPSGAALIEGGAALALAMAGLAALLALPPIAGVAVVLVAGFTWSGLAALAYAARDLLIDPVGPVLAGFAVAAVAGIAVWARTRRDQAAIRGHFERHLDPAVVDRLARTPGQQRLAGERREVTVLVSDIEGFTAMTERLDPRVLVALLDRYLDLVTGLVAAHGGMVDKVVGDAVLAFFNAPADLPRHAERALACAGEIVAATETLRARPENARHGLGRTRIGIETGPVILGDVGSARRLDYTAHGIAVSTASRLEALNKEFGTAVLLGPGARAAMPDQALRALGPVDVRGRGTIEVFTPAT